MCIRDRHIQSVDQIKAIKTVKRKITDLDKSKIEEQKKAVRAGYDMDIIPSDLATYGAAVSYTHLDVYKRQVKDKDKWIVFPNTHEALISREDFQKVQDILQAASEALSLIHICFRSLSHTPRRTSLHPGRSR